MLNLVLEKAEEAEIKLPTSAGSSKKRESSRKTSTFALLTMPKPLTVWITTNWKIPDHMTCLLRNLCAVRKQQLEPYLEQQTGSKSGKEYVKAVYYHPAYLAYMQSESESEVAQSCPTLCDPMDTRLLRPWDFLGKSSGVGCFSFSRELPNPGIEPRSPSL